LPGQRGNVSLSDLEVNNAALCVSKRSQGFPKRLGDLHTIDTRMNRWTKVGVLARMFEKLQRAQVVHIKSKTVPLDSTSIKVTMTARERWKWPSNISKPRGSGTPRFI
jgi:predicted DCC family thiol-disulfide oxidoreductase YuxK